MYRQCSIPPGHYAIPSQRGDNLFLSFSLHKVNTRLHWKTWVLKLGIQWTLHLKETIYFKTNLLLATALCVHEIVVLPVNSHSYKAAPRTGLTTERREDGLTLTGLNYL